MADDNAPEVGLCALKSLVRLADRFQFSVEQLRPVLQVLRRGSPAARREVLDLLCTSRLATYRCLEAAVHALLLHLERSPQETFPSVARAMGRLGASHAVFAECIVGDMLYRTDVEAPVQPEPRLDDLVYVCKMALFLNAAPVNQNLLALLPPWTEAHYDVLKQQYPELLPTFCLRDVGGGSRVLLPGEDSSSVLLAELAVPLCPEAQEEGLSLVRAVVGRVDELKSGKDGGSERLRCLNQCQSDLATLGRSAGDLRGWLLFLEVYVACVAVVVCIRHYGSGGTSKALPWLGDLRSRLPWIDREEQDALEKLRELALFLRHSFEGHAPGHLECLDELEAAAAALRPAVSSTGALPESAGSLSRKMCLDSSIQMIEAHIEQPATSSEEPLGYTAGFPLSLAVEARLARLTHGLDQILMRLECGGAPATLLRLLDPKLEALPPSGGGVPAFRLTCEVRLPLPNAARSTLRLQFVARVPGGLAPLGGGRLLHVAGRPAADPSPA